MARTALEVSPVHIPDAFADPEYTWREGQRLGGFRTWLGVPLLREGTCIGVMALTRSAVQPFVAKQIELVTTFADQAVIAIENVRLFDEVQARTARPRESLQQQTATADVLKVISRSAFDLQTVLAPWSKAARRDCARPSTALSPGSAAASSRRGNTASLREIPGSRERHPIDPGGVVHVLADCARGEGRPHRRTFRRTLNTPLEVHRTRGTPARCSACRCSRRVCRSA